MNNCPDCNYRLPTGMSCPRCDDPGPAVARPVHVINTGTTLQAFNEAAEAFRRAAVMAPGIKLNTDKTVAVSNEVFWNEDMATCPRGVKVQLLGLGGVATYGTYDGKDTFWVKWQSVPRNRTGS